MGLLDYLSPGLTVATGAAGAYEGAKAEEADSHKQDQLKLLEFLRQKQIADSENSYRTAESHRADAQATAAALTPLRVVVDAQGGVHMVPLKYDQTDPTPPKVIDTPIVANPPNQPRATAGVNSVTGKPVMFEAGPGGVSTPVTINGQPVAPVPRARSGSGNMDLVHTMSSVRAQIDQTRRAITLAETQARPLADTVNTRLLTTAGRAAAESAAANVPSLRQKADSLEKVYSALAARQQREAGAEPPATAAPPVVGGGRGGGAGMPVAPVRKGPVSPAVKAELEKAQQQLQMVLNSPKMSPDEKKQAQAFYDARVRSLTGGGPPQ